MELHVNALLTRKVLLKSVWIAAGKARVEKGVDLTKL